MNRYLVIYSNKMGYSEKEWVTTSYINIWLINTILRDQVKLPKNICNIITFIYPKHTLDSTDTYECHCKACVHAPLLSRSWFFATPWTVTHQAPLSVGFPRQVLGVGCHFLLHKIFPAQGYNPRLLHWQEYTLPLSHLGSPWKLSW